MKQMLKEIWKMYKDSVQWDKQSRKQKMLILWFCISFCFLQMVVENLVLVVIAAINLRIAAHYLTKYVHVEDDEDGQ